MPDASGDVVRREPKILPLFAFRIVPVEILRFQIEEAPGFQGQTRPDSRGNVIILYAWNGEVNVKPCCGLALTLVEADAVVVQEAVTTARRFPRCALEQDYRFVPCGGQLRRPDREFMFLHSSGVGDISMYCFVRGRDQAGPTAPIGFVR